MFDDVWSIENVLSYLGDGNPFEGWVPFKSATDFPNPIAYFADGQPLWDCYDVEDWADANRAKTEAA